MYEPTLTRLTGSDVTRSGWQAAPGRADAPRPDAVRSEAARAAIQPLPGATATGASESPADADTWPELPGSREPKQNAAFPTSYARFAIDNETQKLSIKIVDAVTNEVIREIPPEQVQRIAEDLQSVARRGAIGRRPGGGSGSTGTERISGMGVDRYV